MNEHCVQAEAYFTESTHRRTFVYFLTPAWIRDAPGSDECS